MVREVRAKYRQGKIEPVEELDLQEGEEVIILIEEKPRPADRESGLAFERAAGSWEGTLDFEQFLADLRDDRKRQQRPPIDLS